MLLTLLTVLYVACALLLTLYLCGELILLLVYWRYRHDALVLPAVADWPTVTVQLPIYNERHVVERLLQAVARLDYPRDRLTVQVLDDSTDVTSQVIAACLVSLRQDGLHIEHIRRRTRTGYKAGALAYGLSLTQSEYVAVLDADFVPPPDFLRRTIPYLVADPRLGMVQTRWGHLNPFANLLTLGQTLALDSHFVVEQTARSRAGWLMSFNGSGGVWRTCCIREVGGWRDTTLTEDLDLSYRAQIAGWRCLYLPDVVVLAELPPQVAAYQQQQARWAKGNTQCLVRLLGPLWRGRFTLVQRVMATLHLAQYLPYPLMLVLLLATPPLIAARVLQYLPLAPLGLISLGVPLIHLVSQRALYPDWQARLLAFPALLLLSMGVVWSNTRAVMGGLLGERNEFRRTPKFAQTWQKSDYALRGYGSRWVEFLLAAYALWGVWLAIRVHPTFVPYLAMYCLAFTGVILWKWHDHWLLRGH